MTLTEIIFEIADERYPLCKATAAPSEATALMRVLDTGKATGRFRTVITYHGTEAETQDLPRALRASRSGGELEVLSTGPSMVTVRTDSPTSEAGAGSLRLLSVLRLLDAFGPDAILEPFLFRKGRVRARLLVPRRVDTQRALLSLQDVQRNSGFSDFRIIRVTSLEAVRYVDLLRRLLSPDQEELLRLATSMGYYATPKGATLEDIAGRVGLSVSPVHKRLKTIEELLVSAHVDPARSQPTGQKRRRRAEGVGLAHPAPCEVSVRAHWAQSSIGRFTAEHPGSRALLQVLGYEHGQATATFLLVILAPEKDYAKLVTDFENRPDAAGIEVVDRDAFHISLKVKLKLATTAGNASFPWWGEAWGHDAVLRPFIFESGACSVRFLLLKPFPEHEVIERMGRVAKAAGWQEWEFVSVRALADVTPALPPEPPTARQEEVLKIAHALGYYRTPRACTLEHVAGTLGVSANAIHKNLSSAESKVIGWYLSAGF